VLSRLPYRALFAVVALAVAGVRPACADSDAALRRALRPFARGERPGAAAVVVRDGRVAAVGAEGLADLKKGRPLRTDTPLHLASVGKQMTAAAILKLVHREAFELDTRVAALLPELRGWADKVTIRHLLQHTAGLPDYYTHYDDARRPPTNADALALLARWKRVDFAPGTRHDYSNVGYDVLAAVIARVSRVSFTAFMQREIFGPLGMRQTFAFDEDKRRGQGAARGYRRDGKDWELDDDSPLNQIHGSGSIYSSVDDLARYDAALFGRRLLPEKVLAEAFRPTRLAGGDRVPYGLGWNIGDGEVSHDGAWMGFASYYLHREDGLSVIVLSNDADAEVQEIAEAIADGAGAR
jgi:CubicO group peptidase (beta-lactamase class C family)